ncbi:hypothetical protein COS54_01235 [Candidatus Shapirobacteria bacterium CG03_land_8_20_14_0_80_39_12]|uniref:Mannose-1-phosphate guanylyltransferase n=1 Tax=Candidatus Shapirobacteria bacterium CG03_land_8_20_14_0_80_39_12 TaxID=1974879 RepID=A0A2M7BDU6_9BACT|nr:MAG: hypothetical protein COS54_01235 [Candidatus Shapirobacteria bacterium CG03_land_8_20_14_0_80_39_12]
MANVSKEHLYSLIVCGGSGTRLWPRSRKNTPKQFLPNFYGESTLFNQTIERVKLLTDSAKILVITPSEYVDEVLSQSKEILPQNIIAEPSAKGTAIAIGVGAAYIRKIDPEAIIMNFWSDAAIKENDLFAESMNLAAQAAGEGEYLVVLGLKPLFPHTGLGYIEAGEIFKAGSKVCKVTSFKEKPDLPAAQEFVAKGNFYWNTGIYTFSAKSVFTAFSKFSPQIFSFLEKISASIGTSLEKETLANTYEKIIENTPIDLAIAEKADNLLMVPGNFIWSDIGDWKGTYDLKEKDENGNVVELFGKGGQHLGVDTKNCLIEVEDKLVATVGVSDLVVIETKDAILVCAKDKSQGVKKIVSLLKEKDQKEFL